MRRFRNELYISGAGNFNLHGVHKIQITFTGQHIPPVVASFERK